ncbi:hypothetical protein [Streptomyces cavernae]|uniref:hypothetical protein n=1 Tax=Streptomyces cavernae TaxID=2259034 RepID=UPI000FEC199D|nr:hypothetical protein [Streptomyces cavernae]
MEQREVTQRVIAVLTEAMERRRLIRDDAEDETPESSEDVIGQLLTEMMPTLEIPAESTAHDVAALVARELPPAIERMAAAFAMAFVTLAESHDRGDKVSSADVLRALSLDAEVED